MSDYADLDQIKAPNMLDIDGTEHDARLAALNASLSRAFEQKVGRRFGDAEPDITRVVVGDCRPYPSLLLDTPLRSLTSIVAGPIWDGAAWTSGTTLEAANYRLVVGITGTVAKIEWISGAVYPGPYVVTGQWADQPDGTVPDAVVEALNVLVAGTFRRDKAQDGEVSGPEGFSFKPSNPWNDERVKQAIARYSLVGLAV